MENELTSAETPETVLAAKEIAATVNSAMEALPEELRQAVTLREIEGLSYEEIAEVMNCPIGTVRSRIFRAREAISGEGEAPAGKPVGQALVRRDMECMEQMDKQELISALADGQLQGEAFALGVECGGRDRRAAGLVRLPRGGRGPAHAGGQRGTPPEASWPGCSSAAGAGAPRCRPCGPSWWPSRRRGRQRLASGSSRPASPRSRRSPPWAGTCGRAAAGPAPAGRSSASRAAGGRGGRRRPLIRDPRLDKLLAAHRQLGGATALDTSSGFLRNATFEAPSR
jgi:hypothetical protein